MSGLSIVARLLSAVTNIASVVTIAFGYCTRIEPYRRMGRVYDRMLRVTEAERTAVGPPQAMVDNDYGDLP
ncbi:MAG: DUF2782 domain-containing protein [Actinomycetota bacterium]|nr:DUF2782 domain-containing protein [Actinomycetota bacterium]